MRKKKPSPLSPDALKAAAKLEAEEFERAVRWLEEHLPADFLEETDPETRMLIARNWMNFHLQENFVEIHLKDRAIVLCLDSPDADLRILKNFGRFAIRHYKPFVSHEPLPQKKEGRLRIGLIDFRETKSVESAPGIVFTWSNVPKFNLLYRLVQIVQNHGLSLKEATLNYRDPYSPQSSLTLALDLSGAKEEELEDLLSELSLAQYFETEDAVAGTFVKTKWLTGNEAHLVRTFASFVHQALVHADPNLYSLDNVYEGLCRHPELTVHLVKIFEAKFHPSKHSRAKFENLRAQLLKQIDEVDTGQPLSDRRRKNILKQTLGFIEHSLKTNFYCAEKSAFSFRLEPSYLDEVPYDRKEKFPELPYAVFFIRGMHFIGFNIRFKDLARGGFRTVMLERWEAYFYERNNIFSEAYNLAYTQQQKNKDIPEGGAKTAILLAPFDVFAKEAEIYAKELEREGATPAMIEEKLKIYRKEHKLAYLFASQRAFIESFMPLINCDEKGQLKAKEILDFWKRPEYIYLGPDENMLNDMIVWIAEYAVQCGYKPGRSFMSSKPGIGINHKEYGVTSYGVNVYLHQTLLYLGIDPTKDPFTVKISGGPDGDVAGNEIHILASHYPKTAKLVALTDISGAIFDPQGLDWEEMDQLFRTSQSIRNYPAEKLHDGGFLLDLSSDHAQQALCSRKIKGALVENRLSDSETNHLYRSNVHEAIADVFVTGGGRPRTLNEMNYTSYLDSTGKPTSKAIVEGANLYLTPGARRALEKLGVIIFQDSSCNKGGVICSSLEVLASLCMSEKEFLQEKDEYVKEVLAIIRKAALDEANVILEAHKKTGALLTDLSNKVSQRINFYKYQLLDHLEKVHLSRDPKDPLIQCLLRYCPPLIQKRYAKQALEIPDIHKKAIISVFLASHLVYTRGLDWTPSIDEVLASIKE